jgi:hypothetical protein
MQAGKKRTGSPQAKVWSFFPPGWTVFIDNNSAKLNAEAPSIVSNSAGNE